MSILRTLALCITVGLPVDGMAEELMLFPASTFGKVVAPQNQTLIDDVLLEAQVGDYNNEFVANYGENSVFARTGRSVGMLQILTNIGHAPCTAFLVEGNKVITNYHCVPGVLDNPRMKERGATTIAAVQFHAGFFNDGVGEGVKSFFVDPVPIESSEDLDYSVLQVMDDANTEFGALELSASQPDDRAPFWVIGHPMGEAQRISREKCQASTPAISSGRLRHTCDTLPGNSGSPVIDPDSKLVVALHHAGSRAGDINYAIPMADILGQSKVLKAAVSAPPIVAATVVPNADPCDPQFALAKRVNQCAVWDGYLASCSSHSKASEARRLQANVCKVDACDGQFEKAKTSNSCDVWKSYALACGNHDGMVVAEMAVELTCKPVAEEKAAEKPKQTASTTKPSAATIEGWVQKGDEARSSGDYKQAFELYGKAADVGDQCGQYRLGVMHENGLGLTSSTSSAVYWYKMAVAQTGKCSVPAKYSLDRLTKTASAPQDSKSAPSPAVLANWYRSGEAALKRQDYTSAKIWFQKASEHGHLKATRALDRLASISEKEKKPTPAEIIAWKRTADEALRRDDFTKAIELYLKGANAQDPCSQYQLATLYEFGRGTTHSVETAKTWYKKATAHTGNCSRSAKYALDRLAKTATAPEASTTKPSAATIEGWVQKGDEARSSGDYVQAFELFRKAADAGDQCGQYRLGVMHENGLGFTSTASSAVFWYKKAVIQNGKCSSQSQCNLALLIATGKGTIKNPRSAAHWTIMSLQNGNEYCIKNMTESATVREIQRKLKERGLYTGAIDGSNGPNTQAAMRKLLP